MLKSAISSSRRPNKTKKNFYFQFWPKDLALYYYKNMCKKLQKNKPHGLWDYNVWRGKKGFFTLCPAGIAKFDRLWCKIIEEAALKSYTGSQAIQATTWHVPVAFLECFERERTNGDFEVFVIHFGLYSGWWCLGIATVPATGRWIVEAWPGKRSEGLPPQQAFYVFRDIQYSVGLDHLLRLCSASFDLREREFICYCLCVFIAIAIECNWFGSLWVARYICQHLSQLTTSSKIVKQIDRFNVNAQTLLSLWIVVAPELGFDMELRFKHELDGLYSLNSTLMNLMPSEHLLQPYFDDIPTSTLLHDIHSWTMVFRASSLAVTFAHGPYRTFSEAYFMLSSNLSKSACFSNLEIPVQAIQSGNSPTSTA